ncbi:MAG: saccharopine dehydrogenase NADP-binding domain-containing protein [Thermoplasmata archaeon]|nr:MAG: saccharopine dehydrogenase NADP-binding domain-containing protein [Thermoplasmata archaeon]
MGHKYAVLGAGRQGIAAAYDLAKFGDCEEVKLMDVDGEAAKKQSAHVNRLLSQDVVTAHQVDADNIKQLMSALDDISTVISAVPYKFNLALTKIAIKKRINMCDLGGNTGIVKQQLEHNQEAKSAGITIIPDCGMGPGMNISLANYAMSILDNPREVYIWDGGLPQDPKPPWNYELSFNIGGLTNEYYGKAYFIRNGKIIEVECFDGYEVLDFPFPLNKLEAFVTSGGLSTMPWTFYGKLQSLENKTIRYPGHWAQFRAFTQLGLLEEEPIEINDNKVIPREFFHTLLEPKITKTDVRDVGIIRVKCDGEKEGIETEMAVELLDYYDEKTGFSAMQRLTGWHASIVAILAAQEKIKSGAIPIETVPGKIIIEEAKGRGFSIKENVEVR